MSTVRAVPHGLEAYPSLSAAFAAPQPLHSYGVQNHPTGRHARVVVKTPGFAKKMDCQLPRYQHETDLALAVDVAQLWRALDQRTPEHASYTLEKCKFNHDVDYRGDAALLAKLQSLSDFPTLKAFLVEVLEPPPRPVAELAAAPRRRHVAARAAGGLSES